MAEIKLGLADELVLGNLDVRRDWGYAKEYVEAMWLMLQQPDEPDDYVIGTGVSHSVRDLVEAAFACVGLKADDHVRIDPDLARPADIEELVADAVEGEAGAGLGAEDLLRGGRRDDGPRRPGGARARRLALSLLAVAVSDSRANRGRDEVQRASARPQRRGPGALSQPGLRRRRVLPPEEEGGRRIGSLVALDRSRMLERELDPLEGTSRDAEGVLDRVGRVHPEADVADQVAIRVGRQPALGQAPHTTTARPSSRSHRCCPRRSASNGARIPR